VRFCMWTDRVVSNFDRFSDAGNCTRWSPLPLRACVISADAMPLHRHRIADLNLNERFRRADL
jgi:hypothetical protein